MATAKKLKSGNWRTLAYDYTDENGKRHYQSFTADTKKDSEFMAAQFMMEREHTSRLANAPLHEVIDAYIDSSDAVLSPTTVSGYRKIQKNAFASIMDIPLKSITKEKLQTAVNEEAKRPNKRRKNSDAISAKTVRNEYGLVTAVLNKYRPSLDCTIHLPQTETDLKELPMPEQIYAAVKGSDIELAVMLSMWLSYSASELRGLSKSKSIQNGKLFIKEVIVDVDGTPTVKKTGKTSTRIRAHDIPPYIQELIDKTDSSEDRLVPYNRSQLYHKFVALLKKAGIPHMTFHELRHVNASVMAMLQVPDKYAQERGGWKTDRVMKKTYTHTFDEARRQVDAKINDYFEQQIGYKQEENLPTGYTEWLSAMSLKDSPEIRNMYGEFLMNIESMQHKMQHRY